ncbi:MAG: enolase C-terminal domain-like protein [Bryobacterales bacterium]
MQRAIRVAKEIEPFYPFWLEEPIRPENPDAMKKLADHVNIPLASGECNYTKFEFRDLIQLQALDVVQPDICVCGGIMEMKKIFTVAEAQYMVVAPHNPMSPLATAVNVHFAASTPNFLILEYHAPVDGAYKDDLERAHHGKRRLRSHPEQTGLGCRAERRDLCGVSTHPLEALDGLPRRQLDRLHLVSGTELRPGAERRIAGLPRGSVVGVRCGDSVCGDCGDR